MQLPSGLFFAALIATPVLGQETVAVAGAGTLSCGKFAEMYKQNSQLTENIFVTWSQGFFSGLNLAKVADKKNVRDVPVAEKIGVGIRWGCDRRPLATFLDIATDYYLSLPELPLERPASGK